MENRKYIAVVFALLTSQTLFSQIVSGDDSKKEDKKKPKKEVVGKAGDRVVREQDDQTSLYFNANWSNTSRTLKKNEGLFAEEIGKRADETNANFWSYGVGIRTQMNPFLRFSMGLGWVKNGEKYAFSGADSTFEYTTTYSYLSLPLVLDFVYGNELKLSIGGGLMPQMLMRYKQVQTWENALNAKGDFTDKRKGTDELFNPFILSAIVNVGLQYKYSKFWSIYFIPEVRFQLTNTYSKTAPYVQKAMALGFNFGLSYHL